MIVDASALVAIVFQEPGYERLLAVCRERAPAAVAAPTLLEAGIVISARLGKDASMLLHRLLVELDISITPFSEPHAAAALSAWLQFGKGRHRAALNFGDCITYAVAKLSKMPLLCTGKDFAATDLELA